ncbi:outer membrane beta-barrel protein [Lysobacter soyae]|jgi:OOP family OmpA-OmpF porin/outer membrane immunogenic protein|uniref:Porin family protein n=1 Tax=Lysobacter soyae TaxID=2764185 RepID=A0ABX8WQK9_9GAMM|nr:outer membrane beta-barrel protein [Lysobacter sp. CJ11]QYR53110.1 porin family protein [Lysobacter sp. CJ11]
MKNKKTLAFTSLAAAALAVMSTGAFAQDAGNKGAFIRGEVGKTEINNGTAGVPDSKDTSVNVRGGYYFTPHVAVEGFYGRYYDKDTTLPAGAGSVNQRVTGYGVGVVGKMRLAQDQTANTGWYGQARGGVMKADSKVETNLLASSTNVVTTDKGTVTPYVGVGVGYDFTPNVGVGVNYDYFRGRNNDAYTGAKNRYNSNSLTVSGEYRF